MTALQDRVVAIVGAGVMGEAIIKGLLGQKQLASEQIFVSDPREMRVKELEERYAVRISTDNLRVAQAADILVFSVKPQVINQVLLPLRGRVDSVSLIVSIAAGVTLRTISSGLLNARVVRAMPNTPGQIGQGITVWTSTSDVVNDQHKQASILLGALGEQMYMEDERFLDMATALSGTGPAYIFLFMEALIDAGVHMGFSRRDAETLVLQTLKGSVEYALSSGLHPAQLRNQVTSPGGTTAAALFELEKGGLRTVISKGVWAAFQRSIELGDE